MENVHLIIYDIYIYLHTLIHINKSLFFGFRFKQKKFKGICLVSRSSKSNPKDIQFVHLLMRKWFCGI